MSQTQGTEAAPAALVGSLITFSLVDILELLARTNHTGELQVVGRGVDHRVWVDRGDLVGVGAAPDAALFELACLEEGWFYFTTAPGAPEGSRMAVSQILVGLGPQVEEWRDLTTVLPPETLVKMSSTTPGAEVQIRSDQWQLLSLVGSAGQKVKDVVSTSTLHPIDTLRTLREMVDAHLLAAEYEDAPLPPLPPITSTLSQQTGPGLATAASGPGTSSGPGSSSSAPTAAGPSVTVPSGSSAATGPGATGPGATGPGATGPGGAGGPGSPGTGASATSPAATGPGATGPGGTGPGTDPGAAGTAVTAPAATAPATGPTAGADASSFTPTGGATAQGGSGSLSAAAPAYSTPTASPVGAPATATAGSSTLSAEARTPAPSFTPPAASEPVATSEPAMPPPPGFSTGQVPISPPPEPPDLGPSEEDPWAPGPATGDWGPSAPSFRDGGEPAGGSRAPTDSYAEPEATSRGAVMPPPITGDPWSSSLPTRSDNGDEAAG